MFFQNFPKISLRVEAKVVGQAQFDPNDHLNLERVHARVADFSNRDLRAFNAVGCQFEQCRFENMRADDVCFGAGRVMTEYVECTFDGLRFRHCYGGFARFIRCSFRNVNLRSWFCFGVELIDCIFTGRLKQCIFNGTPQEEDFAWLGRRTNAFHGNDFSGADLRDVAFRTGIDLSLQKQPAGPEYLYIPDAATALRRTRQALADWKPESEHQRLALVMVTVQDDAVYNGQRQLLLRREYSSRFPREVVDKVFSLLSGAST